MAQASRLADACVRKHSIMMQCSPELCHQKLSKSVRFYSNRSADVVASTECRWPARTLLSASALLRGLAVIGGLRIRAADSHRAPGARARRLCEIFADLRLRSSIPRMSNADRIRLHGRFQTILLLPHSGPASASPSPMMAPSWAFHGTDDNMLAWSSPPSPTARSRSRGRRLRRWRLRVDGDNLVGDPFALQRSTARSASVATIAVSGAGSGDIATFAMRTPGLGLNGAYLRLMQKTPETKALEVDEIIFDGAARAVSQAVSHRLEGQVTPR